MEIKVPQFRRNDDKTITVINPNEYADDTVIPITYRLLLELVQEINDLRRALIAVHKETS